NAYPMRREVVAQTFGQSADCELRRRIDPSLRTGQERRHRSDIHDVPALSVRLDVRQETHQAVHDAAQVDTEHPLPVLVSCLIHWPESTDAGVVTKNVDLAEYADGFLHSALHSPTIRDIQLDGVDGKLGPRLEPGHGLVEMILPAIADDDLHPCQC